MAGDNEFAGYQLTTGCRHIDRALKMLKDYPTTIKNLRVVCGLTRLISHQSLMEENMNWLACLLPRQLPVQGIALSIQILQGLCVASHHRTGGPGKEHSISGSHIKRVSFTITRVNEQVFTVSRAYSDKCPTRFYVFWAYTWLRYTHRPYKVWKNWITNGNSVTVASCMFGSSTFHAAQSRNLELLRLLLTNRGREYLVKAY